MGQGISSWYVLIFPGTSLILIFIDYHFETGCLMNLKASILITMYWNWKRRQESVFMGVTTMVNLHHLPLSGSLTPLPVWWRWWVDTILTCLVLCHHYQCGESGAWKPEHQKWCKSTITMHVILVSENHIGENGATSPLSKVQVWLMKTRTLKMV